MIYVYLQVVYNIGILRYTIQDRHRKNESVPGEGVPT